jgi:hypothetical protein
VIVDFPGSEHGRFIPPDMRWRWCLCGHPLRVHFLGAWGGCAECGCTRRTWDGVRVADRLREWRKNASCGASEGF